MASAAKQHKAATAAVSISDSSEPLTVCRPLLCQLTSNVLGIRWASAHPAAANAWATLHNDIRRGGVNNPFQKGHQLLMTVILKAFTRPCTF